MLTNEQPPTFVSHLSLGPVDPQFPGPMKLDLEMDGERIVAARVESGFLHRGLEKSFEGRNWFSAFVSADRLDSVGSAFCEMALCLAVEEICNIQVPRRAQAIRLILCELNRVSSHLTFLAKISQSVGFETATHYILRERESILDLFELMTGSRFNLGFFRYGGVVADITEGFIERVFEVCRQIQIRLKEYRTLMIDNEAFVSRLTWLGVISGEDVYHYGITGPNARASGSQFDIRKRFPYSGYELVEFQVPTGFGARGASGDSFDRLLVRLEELQESLNILVHVAERVPSGDFACLKVGHDFTAPAGEAFARVESARGFLGCHVVSSGEQSPVRVQWRTPSGHHFRIIPKLLKGQTLQDVSVILASLDLCLSEVDK